MDNNYTELLAELRSRGSLPYEDLLEDPNFKAILMTTSIDFPINYLFMDMNIFLYGDVQTIIINGYDSIKLKILFRNAHSYKSNNYTIVNILRDKDKKIIRESIKPNTGIKMLCSFAEGKNMELDCIMVMEHSLPLKFPLKICSICGKDYGAFYEDDDCPLCSDCDNIITLDKISDIYQYLDKHPHIKSRILFND